MNAAQRDAIERGLAASSAAATSHVCSAFRVTEAHERRHLQAGAAAAG
jgi:hypothetical protein